MNYAFGMPTGAQLTLVVLHTAAIYLFLVLSLRLLARRLLGQLTVVDLVVVILIGSAVETAMVAGNTTLLAGLVCASTLFLLNYLLAQLSLRWSAVRQITGTNAAIIVQDGAVVEERVRRLGLSMDDIEEAIREAGISDLHEVKYAVLEIDGEITVIPKSRKVHRSKAAQPANSGPV